MSDGMNDCRVRDGEETTIEVRGQTFKVQRFWTRWGSEWWEVRERGRFYGTEALTLERLRAGLERRLAGTGAFSTKE